MNDAVTTAYDATARRLHWLTALLIVGGFILGLVMTDMPLSPRKFQYYAWHKWAGVTVFVLALARLAWRLGHPAPAVEGPALTRRLAALGHVALYLFMLAVPLTGWLMSSAKGVPTVWFGVLPLPDLVPRDKALGDSLRAVHEILNWAMAATVAGHAGAALLHHLVLRDGTLARMAPWVRRRGPDLAAAPLRA